MLIWQRTTFRSSTMRWSSLLLRLSNMARGREPYCSNQGLLSRLVGRLYFWGRWWKWLSPDASGSVVLRLCLLTSSLHVFREPESTNLTKKFHEILYVCISFLGDCKMSFSVLWQTFILAFFTSIESFYLVEKQNKAKKKYVDSGIMKKCDEIDLW